MAFLAATGRAFLNFLEIDPAAGENAANRGSTAV